MDIPPLDDSAMLSAPRAGLGRLGGLGLWLAGVQGTTPPKPLRRRRFVVFGESVPAPVTTLAEAAGVTAHLISYDTPDPIATGPATSRERARAAYDAGVALAGREADSGTDVLLTAGVGDTVYAAAV